MKVLVPVAVPCRSAGLSLFIVAGQFGPAMLESSFPLRHPGAGRVRNALLDLFSPTGVGSFCL